MNGVKTQIVLRRPLPYNLIVLPLVFAILMQAVPVEGLREGLQALQRGDLPTARASLEAASNRQPENPVAWAALAQVYWKSGESERALQSAAKAEHLAPDMPAIQHALAMFYTSAGDFGKAAGFERLFAASPFSDADASLRAATLYLQAGDPVNATKTAQQALAQRESPALHHVLAQAWQEAGKTSLALEEYRAAARLAPSDETFTFDFAQVLFRSDGFTEAVTLLEAFTKQTRATPQIRLALGVAYYGLRRFPEAIEAFLQTIALAPDIDQPYMFLGKMLDQAGAALPRIEAQFELFRAQRPESYLGSLLLAKALMLNGGTAERIAPLLREAIAKNASLWEPHADLADLLSRQRKFAQAALELQRAAKLNPLEPSIPFRLARMYDRLNQPDEAAAQRALHKRLLAQPKSTMGQEQP